VCPGHEVIFVGNNGLGVFDTLRSSRSVHGFFVKMCWQESMSDGDFDKGPTFGFLCLGS